VINEKSTLHAKKFYHHSCAKLSSSERKLIRLPLLWSRSHGHAVSEWLSMV